MAFSRLQFTREWRRMMRRLDKKAVEPPPTIVAAPVEYTIDATGVITLTGYDKIRTIYVDTYSDFITDDLDTINGGVSGDILICRSANSGRDPTFKDGTGNLILAGDFVISSTGDIIMLVYYSPNWYEVSRSDNS